MGVVHEDPAAAVLDLVPDASDAGGDHRPRLPHRLRDGQPEALGQALLDNHRRVALEGVDDGGVLLLVLERDVDQVHPRADVGRQLPPAVFDL